MFVPLRDAIELSTIAPACSLILPAVSVANIGQLAVDLLIVSLKAVKIGYLHSTFVHPIIANDADAVKIKQCTGRISLPIEVYYAAEAKLVIVQQRSPVLRGFHGEFAREMHQFIQQNQFASTTLLSSDSIHTRTDVQIQHELDGQVVEVAWTTDSWKEAVQAAQHLGLNRMQPIKNEQSNDSLIDSADDDQSADLSHQTIAENSSKKQSKQSVQSDYPFDQSVSGGGMTRWLWPLLQSSQTRASLLVLHTAEGDNARESAIMAHIAYQYSQLTAGQSISPSDINALKLKTPLSWQFVFGKAPLASIY